MQPAVSSPPYIDSLRCPVKAARQDSLICVEYSTCAFLARLAFVPGGIGSTQAFELSMAPPGPGDWGPGDILAGAGICPLMFQQGWTFIQVYL